MPNTADPQKPNTPNANITDTTPNIRTASPPASYD